MPALGSIVTGQTEVAALPVLLRRIVHDRLQRWDIVILPPQRAAESSLLRSGSDVLERFVTRVARSADAILVLADDEDGCPKVDAPPLHARAAEAAPGRTVAAVLAWRELETWLLQDSDALFAVALDGNPEAWRDAKQRIRGLRPEGYSAVTDAPALFALLDIDAVAARSDSFRVLVDRVTRLCDAI